LDETVIPPPPPPDNQEEDMATINWGPAIAMPTPFDGDTGIFNNAGGWFQYNLPAL
jgi:hypothetical protein